MAIALRFACHATWPWAEAKKKQNKSQYRSRRQSNKTLNWRQQLCVSLNIMSLQSWKKYALKSVLFLKSNFFVTFQATIQKSRNSV
jgi:hypothetical protein